MPYYSGFLQENTGGRLGSMRAYAAPRKLPPPARARRAVVHGAVQNEGGEAGASAPPW